MRRRRFPSVPTCLILLVALLLGVGIAQAPTTNIIHVDCANATGLEDGTEAYPFDTIQEGIDAAVDGDTVLVYPCTYYENIDFVGKAITVTSVDPFDPAVVDATVIDGGGAGSVVTFANGEGQGSLLSGFTITNGSADYGGGAFCENSSPAVTNNTMVGNNAVQGGGGVYCGHSSAVIVDNAIIRNSAHQGGGIGSSTSSPTITGNTIASNTGHYGGGMYCAADSSLTIADNIISSNSADSWGGGISCSSSSSSTISNNSITANNAGNGAGIYCAHDSSLTIADNIISGNSATYGGGGIGCSYSAALIANNTITGNNAQGGAGIASDSLWPAIVNNIVAFNSSGISHGAGTPVVRHNCVYNPGGYDYSGLSPGEGDISADPRLVAWGYGEAHIQPDSPCIDAGDDSVVGPDWVDIDRQPRLQGAHVDIGADESDGTWHDFAPRTVRVAPWGDDANDGSSWALAKQTVQAGVDAAFVPGGEVWVAAGTYYEAVKLHAHAYLFGGFAATETARHERNWDANPTIIDAELNGSVITAASGYRTSAIDGLTLRNGFGNPGGGGVYCPSSSPIIANNTITGNYAKRHGGGILGSSCWPIITNNMVAGNHANREGGGLCFYSSCSLPTIINNNVTGNDALAGGGISCSYGSAIITGNTITGNRAEYGGGVYTLSASPSLADNTISDNAATRGGGVYCQAASYLTGNTVTRNSARYGGGVYCGQSETILKGNTIASNTSSSEGGGIYCVMSAATVVENLIRENRAETAGGGVYCLWDSAVIASNEMTLNAAKNGGGLCCYDTNTATIASNTISGNSASERGGGISCFDNSSPTIAGNTITGNQATYGGGVSCEIYCSPSLANNIITANDAGRGGGIFLNDHCSPAITNCTIADNTAAASGDGINYFATSWPTVCNSIVWNRIYTMPPAPISVTYSDTLDCWPGEGNICADPQFVDPSMGDYHLLPTSPCIDMGTNGTDTCVPPADDIDAQPRPWPPWGIVDIGADESVPPPTCEISYTPSNPTTDDVITFDSGAADPYDMVISVAWDFGDSGTADTDPAAHQYAVPETYEVTVTVCNAAGVCTTCTLAIVVGKGANIAPVCDVTCEPAAPETGQEVTFDANAHDPNPWGEIVSCDWGFGDGSAGSGDPATHSYLDDGTYTVCATVTDDQGGQATCCTQVVVTYPCECDVAIDRTHCKMPAAGHIGQCKRGQIGAKNLSLTESCTVVMRVSDNTQNPVFETIQTLGPGRRLRVRFDLCYTSGQMGRNLWTWEVWPVECREQTPWNNVHLRRVNVQPGVRASVGNWLPLWRLWRR